MAQPNWEKWNWHSDPRAAEWRCSICGNPASAATHKAPDGGTRDQPYNLHQEYCSKDCARAAKVMKQKQRRQAERDANARQGQARKQRQEQEAQERARQERARQEQRERSGQQRSTRSDENNDEFKRGNRYATAKDYATIGAKEGDDFNTCRQAYRAAALRAHPDRGGSTRDMQRINAAWDRIRFSRGWK